MIALNMQIHIIQPSVCEQLRNGDNGVNAAPQFYFAIQLGIQGTTLTIFSTSLLFRSHKGCAVSFSGCSKGLRLQIALTRKER